MICNKCQTLNEENQNTCIYCSNELIKTISNKHKPIVITNKISKNYEFETNSSEIKREKVYWYISFVLLILSPVVLFNFYKSNLIWSFNPFHFTIILILSLPGSIIFDIIISPFVDGIKLWIVKPSVKTENDIKYESEIALEEILKRLSQINFKYQVSRKENNVIIEFYKIKDDFVNTFLGHSFSGSISINNRNNNSRISSNLTFNDTVIVETGELQRLNAISNFLSLKVSDINIKTVNTTMYSGVFLSIVTMILGLVVNVHVIFFSYCIYAGLGTLGLILVSLIIMVKNKELFGYRLALMSLYFALLPLLSLLIRKPTID